MEQKLARIVSRITGPFTVVPLASLYILFFHTGVDITANVAFDLVFLSAVIVVPAAILSLFVLQGKVSDVDIRNRKERVPILAGILPSLWSAVYVAYAFDASKMFTYLTLSGALTLTALFIVTFWYKVSLHAAGMTVLFFMVYISQGVVAIILFPVLLVVWWARLTLKAHSLQQLVLGTLVPVVIFLTLKPYMLK
ncbi:hypothetical protein COY32_06100 [candidate division WWE3 bacterium CG_4_10_14_0_2_um_filter_41_14]|uniref:Phosphatidic acid phosphatase type 2/haloperoxidase domain-containing protein n=1 Tax=candidate division WWE3 bacterium CG_4_10_14_0_2_um_filter_41_14 TaxID=1975072 RepID=A0A2M7TFK7_UNCKA|nr:MAG: hypothetical protein COY32_06100 [candidate division WWE3 bacterium CG_4_10_14_0_2_um_filter_41_14]